MQTPRQWWRRRGWPSRILVILVALYVLYALVTFFILPGWLKEKGQTALSDLLGRPVTIEKLSLNPLALSATVEGFRVADSQTGTLAGFDRLYVNAEMWASLFHWRPWVARIALDGLDLRVQRNADGSLNFSDILRHFAEQSQPATPTPEKEKSQAIPAFTVEHLGLADGAFRFVDAASEEPVTLTLPVAFTLEDFTTRAPQKGSNHYVLNVTGPDGGTLDWDGRFQLQPFTIQGHLAMSKVDLVSFAQLLKSRFRFRIPSGQLALDADYRFSAAPGEGLTIQHGALTLNALKVKGAERDEPSLMFPAITVEGVSLSTAKQRLGITNVAISKPVIRALRSDEGVDLATLFLPKEVAGKDVSKSLPKATKTKEGVSSDAEQSGPGTGSDTGSWQLSLDKLAIEGAQVTLQDRTLPKPATLKLTDGALQVSDVVVGKRIQWQWQGSATVLGSGHIEHRGTGRLAPLEIKADLDAEALPLAALQPWIGPVVPLTVTGGQARGKLHLSVSGKQPVIAITGEAGLKKLALKEGGEQFLAINALNAAGLSLNTGKRLAAVDHLGIQGLSFTDRINEQGKGTVVRLLAGDGSPGGSPGGSPDNNGNGPAPTRKGAAWRVKLGEVAVKSSRLAYRDASMSPLFKVSLQEWNGSLKGFDSAGGKARVTLDGKVNGNAPLQASGSVSTEPLFVDLKVSLNSYGMNSLTPFTGRYLGYQVQRGLLTVHSRVNIDQQQIDSTANIVADRFYLGDSVASDQALSVPIKLGLAVLRDASGKISLPLEVSGDMADPSFSVSGLVLQVLRNVLVKAATAPFSLLAGLVGGEDLDRIDFPAGTADPSAQTRQKLASLAQVLEERPSLVVSISGETAPADRQALAKQALLEDLGDDWPGLDKAVADGGWFGWRGKILDAFEEHLGRDPASLSVSSAGGEDAAEAARAREAWQQLLAATAKQVDDKALRKLAQQRASKARTLLVKQFGMPPARVTLGNVRIDAETAGIRLGLDNQP